MSLRLRWRRKSFTGMWSTEARPPRQDTSASRFWEAPGTQQRISPVNGRGGVECLVPLALSLSLNLTLPRWQASEQGQHMKRTRYARKARRAAQLLLHVSHVLSVSLVSPIRVPPVPHARRSSCLRSYAQTETVSDRIFIHSESQIHSRAVILQPFFPLSVSRQYFVHLVPKLLGVVHMV